MTEDLLFSTLPEMFRYCSDNKIGFVKDINNSTPEEPFFTWCHSEADGIIDEKHLQYTIDNCGLYDEFRAWLNESPEARESLLAEMQNGFNPLQGLLEQYPVKI